MKPVEQFQNAQIVRQQQVLAHLGYYKGRIDGIWGPGTIKAKKEFESMGFAPGVPNGGLPFASRGPYPRASSCRTVSWTAEALMLLSIRSTTRMPCFRNRLSSNLRNLNQRSL